MRFGVMFANVGPMAHPEGAIAMAQAAEAGGIESLWTVEHTIVPAGYQSTYPYSPTGRMPGPEDSDIPDPLIWLSYVAGATSTIRLGTGILILPQRNPVVLAKEVATLDRLSGGRVELGVGVGWLEEEFDAIGVSFADRGAQHRRPHRRPPCAVDPGPGHPLGNALVVHQRDLAPRPTQSASADRDRRAQQASRSPRRTAGRRLLPRAGRVTLRWPSSSP